MVAKLSWPIPASITWTRIWAHARGEVNVSAMRLHARRVEPKSVIAVAHVSGSTRDWMRPVCCGYAVYIGKTLYHPAAANASVLSLWSEVYRVVTMPSSPLRGGRSTVVDA